MGTDRSDTASATGCGTEIAPERGQNETNGAGVKAELDGVVSTRSGSAIWPLSEMHRVAVERPCLGAPLCPIVAVAAVEHRGGQSDGTRGER